MALGSARCSTGSATCTAPEPGALLSDTSSSAVQADGLLLGLGAGLREL
jgi:hypothetical protein